MKIIALLTAIILTVSSGVAPINIHAASADKGDLKLFPFGYLNKEDQIKRVKLAAVGDLMVHTWQLNDAYDKHSGEYNFNRSFDRISDFIQEADYAVGNLETTFAGAKAGYSDFPIFNTPDAFGEAIKGAGFDFLTTANNHCNDKRENGILRTLDVLDKLGFEHSGTFRSQDERDRIFIKDIDGISFAFLTYTYGTNGIPLTNGKPYLANILDKDLVVSDIKRAKAMNPDFVVVMPHMGTEYSEGPDNYAKTYVNIMLEAGADIVLASHPHVLQPVEFVNVTDENGNVRTCFVAYSLANFISSQRTLPRDAGMILNLYFEKPYNQKATLTQVSVIPTWVQFINAKGVYDIKVLPVHEVIEKLGKNEDTGLRQKDINRIKQVQKEVTAKVLGYAIPMEQAQSEYPIKNPYAEE